MRNSYVICTKCAAHYTVSVLWDKVKNTIVSNESADIIRMFNSSFDANVPSKIDLYPTKFREDINEINEWIYNDINNGVYKCGLSTTQDEYDQSQRFLMGDVFTEADVRLYSMLIRFDEVFYVHFKANKKMIKKYPNLLNYTREIFQFPPVVKSMDRKTHFRHIRDHYYGSHIPINTFGIVPAGPNTDYSVKHDRDRFASATLPEFPVNSN
ncbi:Glutathione S-transferase (GST) [Phytophthora cactorum]|nr:Glutathione S-transferase (GST) [Phytophthora cactorum]